MEGLWHSGISRFAELDQVSTGYPAASLRASAKRTLTPLLIDNLLAEDAFAIGLAQSFELKIQPLIWVETGAAAVSDGASWQLTFSAVQSVNSN
jgi:hypothetical protein